MKATREGCKPLGWTTLWVVSAIVLSIAASLAPASKSADVGFGATHAFADCDTCGENGHEPTGPDKP